MRLLGVLLLGLSHCQVADTRKASTKGYPDIEFVNVSLERFVENEIEIRGEMHKAQLDRQKNELVGHRVQLARLARPNDTSNLNVGAHRYVMSAQKLVSALDQQTAHFQGDVRLSDHLQRRLRSAELLYLGLEQKVVAPQKTSIQGENFELEVPSAVVDLTTERIQATGPTLLKLNEPETGKEQ